MTEQTKTTMIDKTKKKPVDPRLLPLAHLLCEQWDDDWSIGKKGHTSRAQDILNLIDKIKE